MKKPSKAQQEEVRRLVADVTPEEEYEVHARFRWAEKQARLRGAADRLLEGVRTLWEMLTDPDYVIRWETKAWIIAGLTYFISPIDAIPDPIPSLGYLDDALVIAWVHHQIEDEVARYRVKRRRTGAVRDL